MLCTLPLVSPPESHHQEIEELGERADGGGDVGHGSPKQGVLSAVVLDAGGDPAAFHPDERTAASVKLYGQGDEGKQGGDGKQADPHP